MADTRPVPLRFVQSIASKHPSYWRWYEEAVPIARRVCTEYLTHWPEHVRAPSIIAAAALRRAGEEIDGTQMYAYSCAGEWRISQDIYVFDDDVATELIRTELDSGLHSSVFSRLPAYCVWVAAPAWMRADSPTIAGFFARVDENDLVIVALDEDLKTLPIRIPMDRPLLEALAESGCEESELSTGRAHVARIAGMLMYLCAAEPDLERTKPLPKASQRKRMKPAMPNHPTIWNVGYRIGAALRLAKEEMPRVDSTGTGKSPAPHVRRAHWHTFWVGGLDSPERRREVRWLPPIPVNLNSVDDLVPVVRKVGTHVGTELDGHAPKCQK